MLLLDTPSRSLQVALSASKTANDCPFFASWLDISQTTFAATAAASADGTTNGETAVTLVAAPPNNGITRQLKYLSLQNADTVATTPTIQVNDGGTTYNLIIPTLQVGESLQYNAEEGWRVYTTTGVIKTGIAGPTGAQGPTGPSGGPTGPTGPTGP